MVVGFRGKVVDVALHIRIIGFDRARIAIPLVNVPRADDKCASPFRRILEASFEFDQFGSNGRYHAVGCLCGAHIVECLFVQACQVVAVLYGVLHQMRFFQPTYFLTMRTVGQYACHIAADRPVDQFICLVKQRLGTMETSYIFGRIASMKTGDFRYFR